MKWVRCEHCGGLVLESKARKEHEGRYLCADCSGERVSAVVGRRITEIKLSDIVKLVRRL